jgi:hypothetical protein
MEHDSERLDGDALFLWAKLITEAGLIQRSINDFGEQELRRRGYSPGEAIITNDGYIRRQQPNHRIEDFLRAGGRDRSSARGSGTELVPERDRAEATGDGSV